MRIPGPDPVRIILQCSNCRCLILWDPETRKVLHCPRCRSVSVAAKPGLKTGEPERRG